MKKHELFKGGITLFACNQYPGPRLYRFSSSLNLTAGLRAAPFFRLSLFFLIPPHSKSISSLASAYCSGSGLAPGRCPLNYSPWLPTSCSACSVGNCFVFAVQTCNNIFLRHFKPSAGINCLQTGHLFRVRKWILL